MHSIEYDYAPPSFRGICNKNYLNQGYRPLRNADNYFLPNPQTELFKKSPLYALPLKWNNLDDNRYIRNRTTFKTSLKYNLLSSLMDGTLWTMELNHGPLSVINSHFRFWLLVPGSPPPLSQVVFKCHLSAGRHDARLP